MNKLFTVTKGKVKYPTWCPQGLTLKEVNGNREYPVDNYLGEILLNKIGKKVEENIDFEVIQRRMSNGSSSCRTALLCDKGEIAGGDLKGNKWYTTVMEEDEKGKQKRYPSDELTPIQHAQRVETRSYLENVKWRNIQKEFSKVSKRLKTTEQIVDWFRNNINTNE